MRMVAVATCTNIERNGSPWLCRAIPVRFEGSERRLAITAVGRERRAGRAQGLRSRQSANDALKADPTFGPFIPVGRAGCYPAGGVQLAAAGSQLPLTGPFRTGFKSVQAKESASSNVGIGAGASAADCG